MVKEAMSNGKTDSGGTGMQMRRGGQLAEQATEK
jgi:hypothetical protein